MLTIKTLERLFTFYILLCLHFPIDAERTANGLYAESNKNKKHKKNNRL